MPRNFHASIQASKKKLNIKSTHTILPANTDGLCHLQALPQVLSAQQLAAYQQQALQAWAVTAQQSLPNFQLLQGLATAAQNQACGGVKTEPSAAPTPGKLICSRQNFTNSQNRHFSKFSPTEGSDALLIVPFTCPLFTWELDMTAVFFTFKLLTAMACLSQK